MDFSISEPVEMDALYRTAVALLPDGFPEILVFDELPTGGDAIRLFFDDGRHVLCLKYDGVFGLQRTLIKELTNPSPAHVHVGEDDILYHTLDDKTTSRFISCCLVISGMLGIACPQIAFKSNMEDDGVAYTDVNSIDIKPSDEEAMDIITLKHIAHELRHLWQMKYAPEMEEKYVRSEESVEQYFMSDMETDAEAFANTLIRELTGIDLIDHAEGYMKGNKKAIKRVRERENEIVIDEEALFRLQALLGFLDDEEE